MDLLALCLGLIALGSVLLNAYQFKCVKRLKSRRTPSQELQEFVADVMHGKLGVIGVMRMDPNDIIYRSPRQMR